MHSQRGPQPTGGRELGGSGGEKGRELGGRGGVG